MATIKEAKINVFSVIENLTDNGPADAEAEKNEGLFMGYLHVFDSSVLITYTETQEGASVTSEIKYEDGKVRVVRRGAIVSDMLFSEGDTHSSVYTVVPYSFDASVTTRKIRCDIGADGGKLNILYSMRIGGADKRCRMTITVNPV